MLRELFEHQAERNRRIGFDPNPLREDFDPQQAGVWLNNYIAAMTNKDESDNKLTGLKPDSPSGHRP